MQRKANRKILEEKEEAEGPLSRMQANRLGKALLPRPLQHEVEEEAVVPKEAQL